MDHSKDPSSLGRRAGPARLEASLPPGPDEPRNSKERPPPPPRPPSAPPPDGWSDCLHSVNPPARFSAPGFFPPGLSEVLLLEICSPSLASLRRKEFFQSSVKDVGVAGSGGVISGRRMRGAAVRAPGSGQGSCPGPPCPGPMGPEPGLPAVPLSSLVTC